MFYENENEIDITPDEQDVQISDDGVVSWSDIADDTESEDLVGFTDDVVTAKSSSTKDEDKDEDDEFELDSIYGIDEEDELRKILSGESTDNKDTSSAIGINNQTSAEDFKPDEEKFEGEDISIEDADFSGEVFETRKPLEKEKKQDSLPILIALLIALVAGGGGYYLYTYMQDNDVSRGNLERNSQVKEVTQEDIAQRNQKQEDIPIVNDETKDEILSDDKEAKDEYKRESIDVKTEGRADPFLPKSKYLSLRVPESYVNFVNPMVQAPPDKYGKDDELPFKMLDITVSGIMYDNVKPSAIITYEQNDYFVQRGDKLDEYRVIDIGSNYVLIAYGRNTYKASVGEGFKITDEFYGSAKYLPTGRQYSTSDEETYNREKQPWMYTKGEPSQSGSRREINVDDD